MSVGTTFIPFTDFIKQVVTVETGAIGLLAKKYLLEMLQVEPDTAYTYMLPYPFTESFEVHSYIQAFYSQKEQNNLELKKYGIDLSVQSLFDFPDGWLNIKLPMCPHYTTFQDYLDGRLHHFLASAISADDYQTYENRPVFIDTDRSNHLIVRDTAMEESLTILPIPAKLDPANFEKIKDILENHQVEFNSFVSSFINPKSLLASYGSIVIGATDAQGDFYSLSLYDIGDVTNPDEITAELMRCRKSLAKLYTEDGIGKTIYGSVWLGY